MHARLTTKAGAHVRCEPKVDTMLNSQAEVLSPSVSDTALVATIVQLASGASIEINVRDVSQLAASQAFLPPGKKVYISHLPKQTWQDTAAACRAVREAGFDPVPHVPVRVISDTSVLDRTLAEFVGTADVQEILLVAGDYPAAVGPYASVRDVLQSGVLEKHGLKKLSLAGHPEGHPKVAHDVIRHAELEKVLLATQAGFDVTLVTQFFFEHTAFLEWVSALRAEGVRARTVGGLAGPTRLATLFKFALHCGVGPSIRVLGARPKSLLQLIGDLGPEPVIRGLAHARGTGESEFSGIHLFCFGGYLRTCEWLHRLAKGQLRLHGSSSFNVITGC